MDFESDFVPRQRREEVGVASCFGPVLSGDVAAVGVRLSAAVLLSFWCGSVPAAAVAVLQCAVAVEVLWCAAVLPWGISVMAFSWSFVTVLC